MKVNGFGTSNGHGEIANFLQDCLAGMGDYLTKDVGTLAWCEANAYARLFQTAAQFIRLMNDQVNPATSSIYLDQWKTIYQVASFNDMDASNYIQLIQSLVGTPPTISNIQRLLSYMLGNIFIDVEWAPELQPTATGVGGNLPNASNGYQYVSPLSTMYVRVWQPRDNQENILVPDAAYLPLVDTYQSILKLWLPTNYATRTYELRNFGNATGCAAVNILTPQQCFLDGYNVISGSAGGTTITGINTTFQTDFYGFHHNYYPPLEVVDDTGALHTYYVANVSSPTSLTIASPLINAITSRSYRTLGVICDYPRMLDGASTNN